MITGPKLRQKTHLFHIVNLRCVIADPPRRARAEEGGLIPSEFTIQWLNNNDPRQDR